MFMITGTADHEVPVFHSVQELNCLALNIHHEASGESKLGKIAVANVTINRTKSNKFPSTICAVVKQPRQFSWVGVKHHSIKKIPAETYQLAIDILDGKYKDVTRGALYFHNATVESFNRRFTVKIGQHLFYS